MPANLEKSQQWPQDWKRSVLSPVPKNGYAKECSNYCTIALISKASKVMLKIFQAKFQQYVSHELPDFQDGFRKDRGTRHQIGMLEPVIKVDVWPEIQHPLDHWKRKRVPEKKHLFLLYWLCQRLFKIPHKIAYSFHMLTRLCSKSFKLSFSSMCTENF